MDYSLLRYPEETMSIRKRWFRNLWQVCIEVVVCSRGALTRRVVAAEFPSRHQAEQWYADHILHQ